MIVHGDYCMNREISVRYTLFRGEMQGSVSVSICVKKAGRGDKNTFISMYLCVKRCFQKDQQSGEGPEWLRGKGHIAGGRGKGWRFWC